jgi:citrate synthase
MPQFETEVSDVRPGTVLLRGYPLGDVMRELSYTDGAFLSIVGRLPTPGEHDVANVWLNSLLDHGFVASTITAARYIASGNPQFIPAVAGGLLAAGSNTLSPEHAYELLDRAAEARAQDGLGARAAAAIVVRDYRSRKLRLPGFGHPVHKSADFRAEILLDVAERSGVAGESVVLMRAIHEELAAQSGRTLPINIDGAMAAVGRDLGWSTGQTVAFAVLSVLPGLMGHVIEEIASGVPLRYIDDGAYVGAEERALPRAPLDANHSVKG